MFNLAFNNSLDVERSDGAEDAGGGPKPSAWPARLRNVPCFLYPASARVRQEHARNEQVATHQCMTSTDLGLLDPASQPMDERVKIGTRYYEILAYQPFDGGPLAGPPIYVTTLSARSPDR